MSRDSFCFDGQAASGFGGQNLRFLSAAAAATSNERSPIRSNPSARFDGSAFGSGSSVLSAFEPPNDVDVMEKTPLSQTFDDSILFTSSLEELEALISKLQTIYFYRQGLKALTDERMAQKSGMCMDMGTIGNSYCSIPNVTTPRAIPGSTDPIWRMDHDHLSLAPRAVETAAMDMSVMDAIPFQTTLQQEGPPRNPPAAIRVATGDVQREYKRKSRRQNSCPVALCAPQWADASWNPRMTARPHAQTPSHGTGVFLPPTLSETDGCESSLPDDLQPGL